MDDYLLYDDPNDDFLFDAIAFPTHIEKTYAYEAGIIFSDGNDEIIERDELGDNEERAATVPDEVTITRTKTGEPDAPAYQILSAENAAKDASCGIPPSGEVPLLQWPAAVQCRWSTTADKPFEFSLEI
jgi:hypothetical protein